MENVVERLDPPVAEIERMNALVDKNLKAGVRAHAVMIEIYQYLLQHEGDALLRLGRACVGLVRTPDGLGAPDVAADALDAVSLAFEAAALAMRKLGEEAVAPEGSDPRGP